MLRGRFHAASRRVTWVPNVCHGLVLQESERKLQRLKLAGWQYTGLKDQVLKGGQVKESVVPLQLVVFFCLHRRNPVQSRFAEAVGREVYLPVSDQHVTSNDDMQSMQCFSVLEVLRLSNRLLGWVFSDDCEGCSQTRSSSRWDQPAYFHVLCGAMQLAA